MNKNKISPNLIKNVSILSNTKQNVFVTANDFDKTKNFLQNYHYQFTPYRFANCFCLSADLDDINILSNQNDL